MSNARTYLLEVGPRGRSARVKVRVIDALLDVAESALVFAIRGSSQREEREPSGLEEATDLQEQSSNPECLAFTAPTLRDTMGRAWSAYEEWPHVPDGDDTVLSVVSRCIDSVWTEERTTPYFDMGVLDCLQSLCDVLPDEATKTDRLLHPAPASSPAMTKEQSDPYGAVSKTEEQRDLPARIHTLYELIPPPKKFNLRCTIEDTAWTRSFWCNLDGTPVKGRAQSKNVFGESITQWKGRDTFLTGVCSFSPDGTPLYVEADHAEPYDPADHARLVTPLDEIRKQAMSMRLPARGTETIEHGRKIDQGDEPTTEEWPPDYLKGLVGILEDESTDELLDALDD